MTTPKSSTPKAKPQFPYCLHMFQIGFVTINIEDVLKYCVRNDTKLCIASKPIYQENEDNDYFGLQFGAEENKQGMLSSNNASTDQPAHTNKTYKRTSATLQLQATINIGAQFKNRLEAIQKNDTQKHLDRLRDAQRNHEEKQVKLEGALNAHQGLLSSFVRIKGKSKDATDGQKMEIITLAPMTTEPDKESSNSSMIEAQQFELEAPINQEEVLSLVEEEAQRDIQVAEQQSPIIDSPAFIDNNPVEIQEPDIQYEANVKIEVSQQVNQVEAKEVLSHELIEVQDNKTSNIQKEQIKEEIQLKNQEVASIAAPPVSKIEVVGVTIVKQRGRSGQFKVNKTIQVDNDYPLIMEEQPPIEHPSDQVSEIKREDPSNILHQIQHQFYL